MPEVSVLEHPVARKKIGRPVTSQRKDVTVKIDEEVAITARFVAGRKGITLAEYLSEVVRPVADADFEKITGRKVS